MRISPNCLMLDSMGGKKTLCSKGVLVSRFFQISKETPKDKLYPRLQRVHLCAVLINNGNIKQLSLHHAQ